MTGNKGAAIERGKLLAKLRRMRANVAIVACTSEDWRSGYREAMYQVADWVKGSADRATKTPGGLGRKK